MIAMVRQVHGRPVLLTVLPIVGTVARQQPHIAQQVPLLNDAIKRLGHHAGVSVIDVSHPFVRQPSLLPDGIHPNDDGNWRLAHLIYVRLSAGTSAAK
jgi:hypothetical protein